MMRILYWLVAIGLIVLGILGYMPELLNFQWLPVTNVILLVLFLLLSFGDIAITRYNEAQIEKKSRRFRILAQATIASPQDDLKSLAWDGNRLWFIGRLTEVHGLFRLKRSSFTIEVVVVEGISPVSTEGSARIG